MIINFNLKVIILINKILTTLSFSSASKSSTFILIFIIYQKTLKHIKLSLNWLNTFRKNPKYKAKVNYLKVNLNVYKFKDSLKSKDFNKD